MTAKRPRLRVYPGNWDNAVREEAGAELVALETEARQHVAHLRLLAEQLPLWSSEQSQRMIRRIADQYERRIHPGSAA